jgi:hypothetical protein
MLASSRVAWRPSLTVSLYYVTRTFVRSELRYGVRELGRALAPPATAPKPRTLALAAAPGIAAVVALGARTRRDTGESPGPVSPPVAPSTAAPVGG